MSDRYGPDDPVVVQLKEQINDGQVQDTVLPLVDRRKEKRPTTIWAQRLGLAQARLGSRPGTYGWIED
jgi:hypothetical protein